MLFPSYGNLLTLARMPEGVEVIKGEVARCRKRGDAIEVELPDQAYIHISLV